MYYNYIYTIVVDGVSVGLHFSALVLFIFYIHVHVSAFVMIANDSCMYNINLYLMSDTVNMFLLYM